MQITSNKVNLMFCHSQKSHMLVNWRQILKKKSLKECPSPYCFANQITVTTRKYNQVFRCTLPPTHTLFLAVVSDRQYDCPKIRTPGRNFRRKCLDFSHNECITWLGELCWLDCFDTNRLEKGYKILLGTEAAGQTGLLRLQAASGLIVPWQRGLQDRPKTRKTHL